MIALFFDTAKRGGVKSSGTMLVQTTNRVRHLLELDVSKIINDFYRKLNNKDKEGSFKFSLEAQCNADATPLVSHVVTVALY